MTPSYLSNLLHHVVDTVYTEPLFFVPDNYFTVFQFWFSFVSETVNVPVLDFAIFFSCSPMFWFYKAKRLSAIFFYFRVQIWRFSAVSNATSVLHSMAFIALCKLFLHSSLVNQKQVSLWSINKI